MLKNLDINKVVGPDYISPRILCNCYRELSRPLTMFFVVFADLLFFLSLGKLLGVTPVFKHKGSAADPAFYHPVSSCHAYIGFVV